MQGHSILNIYNTGIKMYLAIIETVNNRIHRVQPYDLQADADDHVARSGGFVAQEPDTGRMAYWVVDEGSKTITHDSSKQTADEIKESALRKIIELEATVTPRRIREMTTADGAKWVDDVEKLIAVERGKL
jgi:hypothetical protein